jgi:hypothetical protein
VEHEQLLLFPNLPVIPLLGLFHKLLVFSHQLAIGETDPVDSLQGIVLLVGQEVRGRVFGDGQGLDSTSVRDVRSSTEIDQRSASVDGGRGTVGYLVLDIMLLVPVVLSIG